jgi:streptogramin lyase
MPELAAGTVFAGHRIEALAGRGGMGVVYRATHLGLGRTVALKVIAPTLTEDDAARQRFLRESKIAASIDHPHVIPVYYTGEDEGVAYIAMRYVPGDDLRSLVRKVGPLPPHDAARITQQTAAALDAAHASGLVHRDVKPANVLLGQGEHVYLSDFGLSKRTLSVDGETGSGQWVGTLDYVAPEQIRGERPDARADVYALGGVLYFALTGGAPFPRDGDEAKLWAHLREPPPRPSDQVEGLPPDLDGVVARAMAKRAADRFPSAGDLGRAAVAAAEQSTVTERERVVGVGAAAPAETAPESIPELPPPRAASEADTVAERRGRRRRRAAVIVAGAAALGAVAVAVAIGVGGGESGAPPPTPQPTIKTEVTPKRVWTVRVRRRPNSIAAGDGIVFATNYRNKRVTLVDERTGKLRRVRPKVGVGGRDVATGLGAAWLAVSREKAVYKLDLSTGKRLARIALPSSPQKLSVGRSAVWVGMSTLEPGVPDSLAKVDPRSGRVAGTYPVPAGVRDLVATPAGIWVVHRENATASRLDPRTLKVIRHVSVGVSPAGEAAYGAGSVWVVSSQEDTVVRIDDKTGSRVSIGVGRRPVGIAARGSQIWVTSFIDHTISRIDPKTSRLAGDPVDAPLNPYALALTRDSVLLTGVGRGEIVRIRYAAPRQ